MKWQLVFLATCAYLHVSKKLGIHNEEGKKIKEMK
jgi:hypothetical protein